jgi:hypothetical protein
MPPMTPPTIGPIGVEFGLSAGGSTLSSSVPIGGVGEVVEVSEVVEVVVGVSPASPLGALVGS